MPFLGTLVPLHPTMTDDQLFGGLDLTATLSAGRLVQQTGVLARSGTWVLTMAERASTHLAARLALALDTQAERSLILLDEGADGDEIAPQSLTERLAFWVDFANGMLPDRAGASLSAPPDNHRCDQGAAPRYPARAAAPSWKPSTKTRSASPCAPDASPDMPQVPPIP